MFNFIKSLFQKQSSQESNDVTQLTEPPKQESEDDRNRIIKESKRYIIQAGENIVKSAANYEEIYGDATVPPKLEYVRANEWRVIDKTDNKIKIVEVMRVGGLPVVIPKDIPTTSKK